MKSRFEDTTLYRKTENGRYVSVGPDLQHNTLGEGLWLIRQKDHGKSMTSVVHLVDKLRDYDLTIDDITTILQYHDEIIGNVFNRFSGQRWSLQDISEFVLAEVITKIKEEHGTK